MADTVQTAAQPAGQTATATPAPASGPTTSAEGSQEQAFDWAAEHESMADAFGRPNDTSDLDRPRTQPSREPSESASAPAPSSPADGRQAGGAKVTDTAPAGKEGTPLPGDDLIADFQQFEDTEETPKPGEDGKAGQPLIEPLDTDEKIAKAINPDGKTSLEQQLKNAQSLIGKHGRAYGEAKKLVASIGEMNAGIVSHYEDFQGPNGQKSARLKLDSCLQQIQLHPFEQVQAATEKTGYKIVPKDWNGDGDLSLKEMEEVAKTFVPAADLDLKERLAEIQADPILNKKFDAEMRRHEIQREVSQREAAATEGLRRQSEQQQAARETAEADGFYKSHFDEVKKLSYYPEIQKSLVKWIDYFNEMAPEMPRDMRWKIALGQAQLTRVRKVTRAYGDLRAKAERENLAKSMATGSISEGAQGMFAETLEEADAQRAAEHRKAEANRAELAKAFG